WWSTPPNSGARRRPCCGASATPSRASSSLRCGGERGPGRRWDGCSTSRGPTDSSSTMMRPHSSSGPLSSLSPPPGSRFSGRPSPELVRVADALAAALVGDTLEIGGETVAVRVEGAIATLADRLRAAGACRHLAEPPGLRAELRPYQRRGVAWLAEMVELGLG